MNGRLGWRPEPGACEATATSRRSGQTDTAAKSGDDVPAARASGDGGPGTADPASRVRVVVVEAEGDIASVVTALDAIAEALRGAR